MNENAQEKDVKRIAFVGSAKYRKKIKQEALTREVTVQQFLEDAVEVYLGIEPNKYRGKHAEHVRLLEMILDGEHGATMIAVLRQFGERLQDGPRVSPPAKPKKDTSLA